jgi:hypothetical protein
MAVGCGGGNGIWEAGLSLNRGHGMVGRETPYEATSAPGGYLEVSCSTSYLSEADNSGLDLAVWKRDGKIVLRCEPNHR